MRRWYFALGLLACDSGPVVEPIIVPPPDWCADAPVTTWANFGQSFLVTNCQPCHASTSLDRHDAPVSVFFDSEADVAERRERILINATGDDPAMPPAGGVSAEDRVRLEVWLTCGLE